MTCDEIRVESFSKILAALNEIFPGIQSMSNGNIMTFDDGIVKIEMSGNDLSEGYFDITNDDSNLGELWGVKSVVAVLATEIYRVKRQKMLTKL